MAIPAVIAAGLATAAGVKKAVAELVGLADPKVGIAIDKASATSLVWAAAIDVKRYGETGAGYELYKVLSPGYVGAGASLKEQLILWRQLANAFGNKKGADQAQAEINALGKPPPSGMPTSGGSDALLWLAGGAVLLLLLRR